MAPSPPPETAQDGPSLKLVFGLLAMVTVLLGVFVYWRYAKSEAYVAEGSVELWRRARTPQFWTSMRQHGPLEPWLPARDPQAVKGVG